MAAIDKIVYIKPKTAYNIILKRHKSFSYIDWHIAISTISATKNAKGNKSGKSKSEYEGKQI